MISGKAPITVNTAVQLENVLGIDMQFWLNREAMYREKLARIEEEESLKEGIEWLKSQPVKELKKYNYLRERTIGTDMVKECLGFYGVATPTQWESIYINSYAHTHYRKSDAHATMLSGMAAWLRVGELKVREMKLPEFEKVKFKKALTVIKKMIPSPPEDFPVEVQHLCAAAGVAVIYSISLPKAPISGAARWIGGVPVIQLTDRHKTNDHFWFTFYHEAGHILLHGKKDVFIEDFEGVVNDEIKEQDANDFARDQLLPDSFLSELENQKITESLVRRIAKEFNTHAGIVVGRLQHLKRVHYTFGNNLKSKIYLEHFMT